MPGRAGRGLRWGALAWLLLGCGAAAPATGAPVPTVIGVGGGTAVSVAASTGVSNPTCTFANGVTVNEKCMFVEEFNGTTLSPTWHAIDDDDGPLQAITPDVSCFRHENVSVSGGSLNLDLTVQARGSCTPSWISDPHYVAVWQANWQWGGATSYDEAVVDMPDAHFRYGHISMRLKMPNGIGPHGDVSLWGTNCQSARGVIGELAAGLFALNGACTWPASGSQEFDVIAYSHDNGNINSSMYLDTASAPLMSTWIQGSPYRGTLWTNQPSVPFPAATTFAPNTVPSDWDTVFHTVDVYWRPPTDPVPWQVKIDGVEIARLTTAQAVWISQEDKFFMFWNAAATTVSAVTLPSRMSIDYLHVTCERGEPCTCSGTGCLL